MGVRDMTLARASGLVITALRASSVAIVPGPMALTRMPCGASSMAMTLVSWFMPPFEQA